MKRKLYVGRVRSVLQSPVVNGPLSRLYWRVLYALSKGESSHRIAGESTSFLVDTRTEFMRFNNLMGERRIISDIIRNIGGGDVFYDIGANVGTYTCFAGSKLQSNNVVAFEPEPKNVNRLRENLELNGVDAKIIESTLSDADGTVDLALTGDESGEGKHSIATGKDKQTIEVKTAKADSIIAERELPNPTVVKIDVEGAELSVLRGMKNTLQDSCRLVYVEVHPDKLENFGDTPEEVHSVLEEVGFSVMKLEERGKEYFVKGKKESSVEEQ